MTDTRVPQDRLLDTPTAAEYLGMPADTLVYWRAMGTGPSFAKLGKHVRYRKADLDDYVDSQTIVYRAS